MLVLKHLIKKTSMHQQKQWSTFLTSVEKYCILIFIIAISVKTIYISLYFCDHLRNVTNCDHKKHLPCMLCSICTWNVQVPQVKIAMQLSLCAMLTISLSEVLTARDTNNCSWHSQLFFFIQLQEESYIQLDIEPGEFSFAPFMNLQLHCFVFLTLHYFSRRRPASKN